jgi:hypothetical protein
MSDVILSHEVIIASSDASTSSLIKKLKVEGKLAKIAPKVFTTNLNDTAENIIRRNLFYILGKLYPEAVLSHRTAFEFKPTSKGDVYLTYKYTKKIALPGITLHFLQGSTAIEGDYPFMGGLHISSEARAYLENLQAGYGRDGQSKVIGQKKVEEKLERTFRTGGEKALNDLREKARAIASILGMEAEYKKLYAIIGALLSTKPMNILTSPVAEARALGEPFDSYRINLFTILMAALNSNEFENFPEENVSDEDYANFAFFESYFSNYIEGTEFELSDAKQIVDTRTPISARSADSHDVLGTYYIVANKKEMSVTPHTGDELLEILQRRHAIMMSARPNVMPGAFKTQDNRAGDSHFVSWQQVRGTIKKGFEIYSALRHPFAKATFMLFMTSEVHPFIDGNGRVSRIMMNAELTAAGQSKIIVPTVFRTDYLGVLRQLTRKENPEPLIHAMERLRLFGSKLHGMNFEQMRDYMENCNAFKDDNEYVLKF